MEAITGYETDNGGGKLGRKKQAALPRPKDPLLVELDGLVQDALAEKEGALQRLREFLEDNPPLWKKYGDLSRHARMSMVRAIAGENVVLSECVMRQARELETQLAGPNPSPIEKLSVERVVACWLEMQWVDTLNPLPQGKYLPQAKFNLRLKESAQHRYHAAVRSLMLVRKMESTRPQSSPAAERASSRPPQNGAASSNGSERAGQKRKDSNGHSPPPWQNRVSSLSNGQQTAGIS